jgi:hypothetical protein
MQWRAPERSPASLGLCRSRLVRLVRNAEAPWGLAEYPRALGPLARDFPYGSELQSLLRAHAMVLSSRALARAAVGMARGCAYRVRRVAFASRRGRVRRVRHGRREGSANFWRRTLGIFRVSIGEAKRRAVDVAAVKRLRACPEVARLEATATGATHLPEESRQSLRELALSNIR